ncbi:hypothetical protein LUZ63_022768 [Rhynchospora breviuscula]|uniref:CN hydrolase domain-containing protein n=1 Tax=Rhynchospora breviuscula TaxID=2022672 RepID=A0A9P9Z470_9POAL|nr:hypothetical protein LUZ63_022768 [Rhynchospora breviuscula]
MTHDSVGVAVAQFAPSASKHTNLESIAALARTAAARGARVVVFPEYSSYFVDPFDLSLAENAEDLDGPFTEALRALADELDVVLVAGLVERADDGRRVRNAVVAVGGAGIRAVYRKLHLYDAFGQRESDWVAPGEIAPPETFETDGLRFGLMTCYDLRFPEVARTLADAAWTSPWSRPSGCAARSRSITGRRCCRPARSRTPSSSPARITRRRSASDTPW